MKLRATVAYDGTDFHGFQRQTNARSVQGVLEEALEATCGHPVCITGAGRTDTGVHATGQVVAFDVTWRHELADLHKALNSTLPDDVSVLDLAEASEDFHPRYSALSRTYEYTVVIATTRQPLVRRYAWQLPGPMDVQCMNEAARGLVGEHDFAAFGTAPQGEVTIRRVMRAEWRESSDRWPRLTFCIEANAFLFRMVRRIVKALALVGQKRLSVNDIDDILASKDSGRVKGLAPACGLCLVKVTY